MSSYNSFDTKNDLDTRIQSKATKALTKKHTNGFSLIEVMIAILLISLSMLLFGNFAKSLKVTSNSRQETQAITDLRSSLDKLRSTWSTTKGYNSVELPNYVASPKGYTHLKAEVKSIGNDVLDFSCDYSFNTSRNKFENTCQPEAMDEKDSLLRSVSFTLEAEDKPPLALTMQIARPLN